ncbi:phage tail family protein [Listeria seeligeri]|uniref:phage tail family protein n=1 Tax=Listeria seeligeri TaxID=1640 RepID=UPI0016244BE9|nr:phage tail family protein [Listeria seeligeri]MBC1470781.1 phage tail family protein [Listeria seeligeri]MBC1481128.1 phage tail family protein [Listeria seeligeri]MBC1539541.1 phage tail family protein [Listeria seeligeri]MBC1556496.1 phage tail family protein [Listeria seeligeri]MBC1720600.1 phage tail family protein [Listeria seeligeri]
MSDLFLEIDGQKFSLCKKFPGVFLQEVGRQGPQMNLVSSEVSGVDGSIPGTVSFSPFVFSVQCNLQALDISDYHLAVKEIYEFLFQRESYYIWSNQMPGIRYEVYPKPFDFSRETEKVALITLEFVVFKGYAESRGTTLDPLTFETNKWQIGMNIQNAEDNTYVFMENKFRVYNASSEMINPLRRHDLDIALTAVGNLRMTNLTTGDTFQYNKALKKSDVLLISGVYPYVNDERCGRETNHGIITLAKGWNEFEINGVTNVNIAFNFPFIYR